MKKLCIGIISLMLSFNMFGQYQPNDKIPFNDSVTYGKLDNGLTYYIKSNSKPENRAELTLAVYAGSVLEDEDQQGLAHFCEHMAFNGTKNFPKHELINYMESTGMEFGADVNAYTSFDETVYGITVPLDDEEMLDKGLLVLHDWAHYVSFEPEEIDAERGVIHEEWRMGQGAMDRMQREFMPKIFYNSQYAERLPIGKMDVVDNCKYETLKRFYNEWYRPELMAVVAVGDFDEQKIEAKIKEKFSDIPAKEDARERKLFDIPNHDEILVSVASDPEAPMSMVQIYTKHPIINMETVADYREKIVSDLVSTMLNDRLSELTMQEEPPFVQGFAAHSNFIGTKSVFMSIGIPRNNDVQTALKALVMENQRAKKHGFTETELDRAKSSLLKQMEKLYKERNKRKSSSIVEEYKRHFLYPHDPVPGIEYEYELYQKYLPEITIDQVNKKIDKLVIDNNKVIVLIMPEKEGIEIPSEEEILTAYTDVVNSEVEPYVDKVTDKPLLEKQPEPVKIADENINKILDYTVWEFDNGVKVIIKPTDFKDDEILFKAVSPGGSSLYGQKDDISADIVAEVASESGIGNFDRMELDKYLSDKNVQLRPNVNETSEGLNGKCSPDDLETMLQMIYLNFTKPRVTESGFNTYINKLESQLENKSLDPQSVWQDSIQAIMANYHPRRRPLTPEILGEASYSKIRYIMKSRFGDPGNFTFYFVGNINPDEVIGLFETYLGSLPKVNREEDYKDLGIEPPSGIVDKTIYKGTDPKSMVVINFHGDMEYTVENRLHIDAICKVLSTKLLEEIRENKSGVYTIGAYPDTRKDPKEQYRVTIFFSCDPERVDELTEAVFVEIEKLQKNGPTDTDLQKVIEKEKRAYEVNLQENRYWLQKLEEIEEGSIADKDVLKYEKYIDKLDTQTLKEAANTFFNQNEYIRITLKPEKGSQEKK
ncbi:MAG: M16 family metallopeptidase [Bacteroidales bacterium]